MARPRRRPSSEPVERPADLDRAIPFPPMEAELVRELPDGKEWQYEPKWDGFRGLLENGSGDLRLGRETRGRCSATSRSSSRSRSSCRRSPRSTARS